MKNGMSAFLSEGSIREHKEYFSELKHRASIYSKSGIDIKKVSEGKYGGVVISRAEREKIINLVRKIKMHEIYFESFGNTFIPSEKIKKSFGSENNFGYLLSEFAKSAECEFVCVYSDRAGHIDFCSDIVLPHGASVHLALDLAEHAYYKDYGFKKDAYIRAALSHFDFKRLKDNDKKDMRVDK